MNPLRLTTAFCSLLAAGPAPAVDDEGPPNIVLIVSDDQGFADVGFRGSEVRTPNLDRLAKEGAVLQRFYVCPICSPTRAGLLTGRYPIRFGAMRAVIPPWREGGLSLIERTLPKALGEAGYDHRGCFGKWHLGHSDARYHPLRRGFTEFTGHYNGAIDYFTKEREGERDWHDGFDVNRDDGYATDLIADRAARFIGEHADEGPFFCYVPFNAPHSPFQVPAEALDEYEGLDAPARRRTYAAMVTRMDLGVGRILDAIDGAGVADRTLVWFLSDNGGTGAAGRNDPLRGTKSEVFEGGIRSVSVVRWPGSIPEGSTVEGPLAYIDVMPTLLRVAGAEVGGGEPLDGIDARDVLGGARPAPDRELYSYWGQRGEDDERMALHATPWKLVALGPNLAEHPAFGDGHRLLLFDLRRDPNERRDVAARHPEVVRRLLPRLVEFRRLQPADGVPAYDRGREGFEPPEDWAIPGAPG